MVVYHHRWLPLHWLEAFELRRHLGKLARRSSLTYAFTLDSNRLLQGFAIADARLADPDLETKITFHAMLLDLEVQHPHSIHERLPRIAIDSPRESWILTSEPLQDL